MISRQEWRWVWIFATSVMVVTSLPYLYAYAVGDPSNVFSGFIFGVEDGNSYIAKMMRGSAGDWLFQTPFTAYPQKGILAFLPYLLLGKLTVPPEIHTQLVILFHAFRLFSGIVTIAVTYFFASIFITRIPLRRLAVLLINLGGGLGWLLLISGKGDFLGSPPLEFFSPESFGFLSLYGIPHLIVERGLLLTGLGIYLLKGRIEKGWVPAAFATGLTFLIMGTLQPAALAVVLFLILIHLMMSGLISYKFRKSNPGDIRCWQIQLKFSAVTAGISLPYLFYYAYQFSTDPVLSTWLSQNILTSPHPIHYLLAYAIVAPFTIMGAMKIWQSERKYEGLLLIAWVVVLPVLAYAPVSIQRRLVEGIWVAWVILACYVFQSPLADKVKAWKPVLYLTIPSSLILLVMGFVTAGRGMAPVFLDIKQVNAFKALQEVARPDDILLAAYETGNRAPAYVPVRVVIGHGPESAHLKDLLPKVEEFYSGNSSLTEQIELVNQFSVDYVFWGPAEKSLGSWTPDPKYFQQVYSGEYSFYKVLQREASGG